jgi:glycosyltransferase involved in cell wall biosynthesis
MKLAYLVSQYPAANHAFMLRETSRLRQLGFDVDVVSIRRPDRPPDRLSPEERDAAGATFYVKDAGLSRVAVAHARTLVRRPLRYLAALGSALRLGDGRPGRTLAAAFYFVEAVVAGDHIDRSGASHVHCHYASTVGLLVSRLFPVTLSATLHGPDEFENPAGFRLRQKVEACRFVCAISSYARSQVMKNTPMAEWGKIEVVPLGVDTAVFAPSGGRPAPSPVRLVCAGRLAAVKGQHVLLAAMASLVTHRPAVVLHLAGDGPDREALERDVHARGLDGRVVFEGLLNQDRLQALYRESDAMVLASFAEGVPVVLMEAMAMGIPCVATWVAGVPELIADGVDGLLVPAGDADALAEAVGRLVDDAGLRRRLGRAATDKVRERYDLDRNVARLADVFTRRLGGRS